MYAGTPELQLDYFLLKSFGISTNFGYTYKPVRGGFIKVGDFAEVHSLEGYYLKTGLKYRSPVAKGETPLQLFVQLFYIVSFYDETGWHFKGSTEPLIRNKGFVNGFAFTFGTEIRLLKRLDLRFGYQLGAYAKRNHLGFRGHTYQPGLGTTGQISNRQLIIGMNYKFGLLN